MNLLPSTEKQGLKKGLKLRFWITALFILSSVFIAGFILLMPAYLLTPKNFLELQTADFLKKQDPALVEEINNLPKEIDLKSKFLQSNVNGTSTVEMFSKIISYLPNEVSITSISFSKNQTYKEKNGTLIVVSGISKSRDSLVAFSNLLEKSGMFSDVNMPVSNLAKDKGNSFSLSLFIEKRI